MYDEFKTFVEFPTAGNYRAAREALFSNERYFASPQELVRLERYRRRGDYEALRAALEAMMPRWALSPRVHWLAAEAAAQLGDEDDAHLERFVVDACLQGILATGCGSAASPYLVTYSADENDVLAALGWEATRRSLKPRGKRFCELIACRDGRKVWFDVTETLLRTAAPHRSKAAISPS